jgi:hypothetical protein
MSNSHIQEITSSYGITCSTSNSATVHHPDNTKPNDGVLRTNCGSTEYYNANVHQWMPLHGQTTYIGISSDIHAMLDWAKDKMAEDFRINELAQKYPALKKAKENFDVVKALVENEN